MLLLSQQQQHQREHVLSFISFSLMLSVIPLLCICSEGNYVLYLCLHLQSDICVKGTLSISGYLSPGDNVFQAQLGISVIIFVIIFQFSSFLYLLFLFVVQKKQQT